MTTEIKGEYTTAKVALPEDEIEDLTKEQIQEMVDHEAFTEPIRVMADCHPGAGCVIGFSSPLPEKVIPNVVGVDIGCGVETAELKELPDMDYPEMDERIRDAVPMGYEGHDDQDYHIKNDFPWRECYDKWFQLSQSYEEKHGDEQGNGVYDTYDWDEPYDIDYFKDLCEKAGVPLNKAINQMGSLGGGNHFLELTQSESHGDYYMVIHSGSRALGNAVAQYWQDKATENRNDDAVPDLSSEDVPGEVQEAGGTVDDISNEEGGVDMESAADFCRENFDGEEIEANLNRIRQVRYDRQQHMEENRNTKLDYLEGEDAQSYLVDMIFCQEYALENRRYMVELATDALGVDITESVSNPHNLISPEDLTIRKGATKAHKGETCVIPMNMGEGSLVMRGKGNEEFNRTLPHGAGRKGSRTWAKNEFTVEQFEEDMEGVYSSSISEETLDESPRSYKDPDTIESNIGESGEIVDRLKPLVAIKADW